MKRLITISFATMGWDEPGLRNILREHRLDMLLTSHPELLEFADIELEDESPECIAFLAMLRSRGCTPRVRRKNVYDIDELLRQSLLGLVITSHPTGMGGAAHGTVFDTSAACQACGSGAQQVSDLVVSGVRDSSGYALRQLLTGEKLVSAKLVHDLLEAGFAANDFRRVVASGRATPLSWLQLTPEHQMPPWSGKTTGIAPGNAPDGSCKKCRRDQHCRVSREPVEVWYPQGDACAVPPLRLARTWELSGKAAVSRDASGALQPRCVAQPFVLVPPDFVRATRARRVARCEFFPVRALPD